MPNNVTNILAQFQDAAENPGAYARAWKDKNQKDIVGFFCSYVPEEILLAADVLPFRIFGGSQQVLLADAHLQAYSCSLVRGALEEALAGRLNFMRGTVFPHTCDSIMRLSDMWRINLGFDFHIDLVLPVKLNQTNARVYLVEIIRKFKQDLEKALRLEITDDQLRSSIQTINRIRKLLSDVYELKLQEPMILSGSEVNALIKGSMIMDRYEALEMLETLLKRLRSRDAGKGTTGKRLLLAGGLCSMPDIFDLVEKSGGVIVADDFCTGARYASGQVNLQDDLLSAIADRYAERIVCPAKHSGCFSRGDHVLRLAKEKQVDGVIFLYLKFCDPHAFDYPYMKELLTQAGIPSMLFEIEDQLPSEGQFKTRCEAFLEML